MKEEFTNFLPKFPESTKNLLFWMVLRETFVFRDPVEERSRSELQVGDESPPFEMMLAMLSIPLLSSSTAPTEVMRKEPSTVIFVQN